MLKVCYWWQILQPSVYSTVVIRIVSFLAKVQDEEFPDLDSTEARSTIEVDMDISLPMDQSIDLQSRLHETEDLDFEKLASEYRRQPSNSLPPF